MALYDRTENLCTVSTFPLSHTNYKALEKFSKALYRTTGGTYSTRVFRPVKAYPEYDKNWVYAYCIKAEVITIYGKSLSYYKWKRNRSSNLR